MSKNSSKALNWIAGGIAAYFVGSAIAGAIKRKNATSGIGATGRYVISIRPNGTNYETIYGRYGSYNKAVDALRNMPFSIRRLCAIHLIDSATGD